MNNIKNDRISEYRPGAISVYIFFLVCPFCYLIVAGRALYFYLILFTLPISLIGLLRQKKIKFSSLIVSIFVIVILDFCSALYSVSPNSTMVQLRELILMVVPVIVFSCFEFTSTIKSRTLFIYCASIFLIVLILISQRDSAIYWNTRITVNFGTMDVNPNFLSFLLIIPFAGALNTILSYRGKRRALITIFCILVMFMVLYGAMLTGSRSAFVAICIIIIIQGLGSFTSNKSRIITILLAALIGFVLYNFLFDLLPEYIRYRMQLSNFADSSGRFNIWQSVLKRINMDNTLGQVFFGNGYGTSVHIFGLTTHNMFLEILVETGLFGLAVFCFFITKFSKLIFTSKNIFAISVWCAVLILSQLMVGQSCRYFWFDVSLLLIIVSGMESRNKKIVVQKT
jgi:O-antigen ligase